MIFKCEKKELQTATANVSRAAAVKSPVPAMEGILLETDGGKLKLTAYDGKIGIYTRIEAEISEDGAIVIPARFLVDLVRKLPEGEVTVKADRNCTCVISCGKTEVKVGGYDPKDFPELSAINEIENVGVPEMLLKSMIQQTIFAVSASESRPIYTGILFEVGEHDLTLVAIDGYRMAKRSETMDNVTMSPCRFVIPGSTCAEVERICNAGKFEDVAISLGDKHASFSIGDTVIVSRRLEGEFMNYQKSIPAAFEHEIIADRKDLMNAIDRTALVIHDKQSSPVEMTLNDGYLELECNTTFGHAADSCFCEGDGGGLRVGFNDRYFMDALKAVDEDRVKLCVNKASSPIILKAPDGSKYLYMVLPVRLRAEGTA